MRPEVEECWDQQRVFRVGASQILRYPDEDTRQLANCRRRWWASRNGRVGRQAGWMGRGRTDVGRGMWGSGRAAQAAGNSMHPSVCSGHTG